MVPFSLNSYICIHAFCIHENPWLCCEDAAEVSPYPGVFSSHFCQVFQLGYGLVKRLVGLGRFELDHPALQCFSFCISILFEVLGECNLLLTDCTRHLTCFKYSCLLISPSYTSSSNSSSLLMTLLASFPGLGPIAIEEHQHENILPIKPYFWN